MTMKSKEINHHLSVIQAGSFFFRADRFIVRSTTSGVAPQLTVVTNTTAPPSVAALARGDRAAWVGSNEGAARETTNADLLAPSQCALRVLFGDGAATGTVA